MNEHDTAPSTTDNERAQSLKSVGWLSYLLHLIVAVGAVIPGTQPGVGVPMVLVSGRLAAERILGPDPLYRSRALR